MVFMTLLAVTTVVAIQVVGVLLVFSLIVAPAATAHAVTARPYRALFISVMIALWSSWLGLLAAVWWGGPVSFWITALAAGTYGVARSVKAWSARSRRGATA